MFNEKWSARHLTDSAQHILTQIPSRASARGLFAVDGSSIVMLALWSLLLWERKVGRVALERLEIDTFDLARELDVLLNEKANERPVVNDSRRQVLVVAKTGEPYRGWDFDALLEPLLRQAEHEAMQLKHDYIGSEHLLLAIVRLAGPALSELLQRHGIVHGRAQKAVVDLYLEVR